MAGRSDIETVELKHINIPPGAGSSIWKDLLLLFMCRDRKSNMFGTFTVCLIKQNKQFEDDTVGFGGINW